jgi:hypothetical protein
MSSSTVPAKAVPPAPVERVLPERPRVEEPIRPSRSTAFRLQEAEVEQQQRLISGPAASGTLLPPEGCAPLLRRVWLDVPVFWGLLALLAAAGGLVLFYFDPRQYHFYPVCFFYQTTGLLCPGCGASRAMHQLLHGHVATAFRFNPVLIVSLPILGWLGARYVWQKARNEPVSLGLRPCWLWLILAVVLVVSVLRNLPGAPLALLRP